MEQDRRFCKTEDGVRIAYAKVGDGPPLIRVLGWFTHLEFDWNAPSTIRLPLMTTSASGSRYSRDGEAAGDGVLTMAWRGKGR